MKWEIRIDTNYNSTTKYPLKAIAELQEKTGQKVWFVYFRSAKTVCLYTQKYMKSSGTTEVE